MKLFYQLKREYRFFVGRLKLRREQLIDWYYAKTCPHVFRPARAEGKPAKICNLCDAVIILTPAEYFSEYGEKGWQDWK